MMSAANVVPPTSTPSVPNRKDNVDLAKLANDKPVVSASEEASSSGAAAAAAAGGVVKPAVATSSSLEEEDTKKKPAAAAEKPKPVAKKRRKRAKKPYRRAKKPLDMPKRPLSGYNFFFREQRELMLEERDRLEEEQEAAGTTETAVPRQSGRTMFEVMGKTIAARWKALSEQGHVKYSDLAATDTVRYKKEMIVYNDNQANSIRRAVELEAERVKQAKAERKEGSSVKQEPEQAVIERLANEAVASSGLFPGTTAGLGAPGFAPHQLGHMALGAAPMGVGQFMQLNSSAGGLLSHHHNTAAGLQAHLGGQLDPYQTAQLLGGGIGPPSLQSQLLVQEAMASQRMLQERVLHAQLARMQAGQQQQQFQLPADYSRQAAATALLGDPYSGGASAGAAGMGNAALYAALCGGGGMPNSASLLLQQQQLQQQASLFQPSGPSDQDGYDYLRNAGGGGDRLP